MITDRHARIRVLLERVVADELPASKAMALAEKSGVRWLYYDVRAVLLVGCPACGVPLPY